MSTLVTTLILSFSVSPSSLSLPRIVPSAIPCELSAGKTDERLRPCELCPWPLKPPLPLGRPAVPALELFRPENHCARRGRRVGRHAQIRATFVSTTEKEATVALSKDGSVDWTITRSGRRRTMETTQTLHVSVSELSPVIQTCGIAKYLHGTKSEYTDQQRFLLLR